MRTKTYKCKHCGAVFDVKNVITREEALEKRTGLAPIRCPKCGSEDVIEH